MELSREESCVGGVVSYTEKLNEVVSEMAAHVRNDEAYKVKKDQMDRVKKIANMIHSIAGDFREADSFE